MEQKIDRIVELDIELDELTEEQLEEFGVQIVSIVNSPAIEEGFYAFENEEFIKPSAGESEDEFIGRCMSKLEGEFPDEEQRLAVCYSYYEGEEHEFESYTDYPEAASNNAKRALKWAEENGWGDCGTPVGKRRANQLANREPISEETIARMSAFRRQQENKNTPYGEGCGGLMWDAWGGDAGIDWAERKLKQIRREQEENSAELSDEAQKAILDYCTNNGLQLTREDVIIDLKNKEFATVTSVIDAIRGLDILRRLNVKEFEPETYFKYVGPPAERQFCKAMMNLSSAGKIYSKEDITKLDGLNSQFSKKGQSSYSIFKFKGGKNCKHYWEKVSVFKNDNGQRVVIVGQADSKAEETALTPWANLSKMQFALDDEKRMVTGPLMIPNKMILRRDAVTDDPYYIYFSKETIKKMAERFLKLNKHNNTDINHDNAVTNTNTLVESWISDSPVYDKSHKYGFALPAGTWYVTYKINDDETWDRIKSGELKGYSLAGGFIEKLSSEKINSKTLSQILDVISQIDE